MAKFFAQITAIEKDNVADTRAYTEFVIQACKRKTRRILKREKGEKGERMKRELEGRMSNFCVRSDSVRAGEPCIAETDLQALLLISYSTRA